MKLFDYTKWEILEVYNFNGDKFCVQVRMNKRTGFKHFKTNKINRFATSIHLEITPDKINSLTQTPN